MFRSKSDIKTLSFICRNFQIRVPLAPKSKNDLEMMRGYLGYQFHDTNVMQACWDNHLSGEDLEMYLLAKSFERLGV